MHVGCHTGLGKASDMAVSMEDYWKFVAWLRCYENPEMNNMKDHNGRTMWFKVSIKMFTWREVFI